MRLSRLYGLWLLCSVNLFSQAIENPDVFFLSRNLINKAQESYQKDSKHLSPALSALMKDAGKSLNAKPLSVMDKNQVPPSGDKHDYMSIAPYWWPDTTKPGGVPYIRRDGERNPERHTVGDRDRLGTMVESIQTLALAYSVSDEEKYAQGAIEKLAVWFLDPQTRMNPNLKYAQSIKGQNEGRGSGIIDSYSFRDLVDAMILLRGSKYWSVEMDQGMKRWFTEYLVWLQESANGKTEAAAKNNHGSTYDVQVSCIALFLGNVEAAKQVLRQAGNKRIAAQIEPDGSQPHELARTKSWGYCMLNTEALINLAVLGDRVGINLWHFQTGDGRSLRKAIDFLVPYALGKKQWMWKQIAPPEFERMYPILKLASDHLNDSSYKATARSLKNKFGESTRINFSLSAE
jgi:hypothetical protein